MLQSNESQQVGKRSSSRLKNSYDYLLRDPGEMALGKKDKSLTSIAILNNSDYMYNGQLYESQDNPNFLMGKMVVFQM